MITAALILDATVIRMLLVPPTMKLLGDDCWWAPQWMKTIRRKLGLGETIRGRARPDGRNATSPPHRFNVGRHGDRDGPTSRIPRASGTAPVAAEAALPAVQPSEPIGSPSCSRAG